LITSNGYTVPIEGDQYLREIIDQVSKGTFSRVGSAVIPVGRTEWYQPIEVPDSREPIEVVTSWTERETALDLPAKGWDLFAPFFALYALATSPNAGDEVEVETRKIALPVRLLAPLPSDFVGPLNLPPDLSGSEADKRESSAAESYAESRRQLQRDLEGIVTPDFDLFDSPIAKWAIVAGVMVAVLAVVVAVRRR
jgi:hypothetical protein